MNVTKPILQWSFVPYLVHVRLWRSFAGGCSHPVAITEIKMPTYFLWDQAPLLVVGRWVTSKVWPKWCLCSLNCVPGLLFAHAGFNDTSRYLVAGNMPYGLRDSSLLRGLAHVFPTCSPMYLSSEASLQAKKRRLVPSCTMSFCPTGEDRDLRSDLQLELLSQAAVTEQTTELTHPFQDPKHKCWTTNLYEVSIPRCGREKGRMCPVTTALHMPTNTH
jgi:hypothetical protein